MSTHPLYLNPETEGEEGDPIMDAIAFSGGGMSGIGYIGVLRALEERGYRKHIRYWLGASVGSIFATLSALGASALWLEQVILEAEVDMFLDFKLQPHLNGGLLETITTYGSTITNLIEKLGVDSGTKLVKWFSTIMVQLGYCPHMTFEDFYLQSGGVHLCINITSINTNETLYVSRSSYPNMKIIDAIRASIALPFVFQPIYMNDPNCLHGDHRRLLADGGIYDNLPITALDLRDQKDPNNIIAVYRKIVGFTLVTDGKWTKDYEQINGIFKYSYTFVEGMHMMISSIQSQNFMYWDRVVPIECYDVASVDFALDRESMKKLIDTGYQAAKSFCKRRERLIYQEGPLPRNYFIPTPDNNVNVSDGDLWKCDLYQTNPQGFARNKIPINPNYNII